MQVRSVGFSIVRQPGPFELEVDWIKGWNTEKTVGLELALRGTDKSR
jgi:hypothetical protein